jgi:hypothetical protein
MGAQVKKIDIDAYLKLPVSERPAALADGRFSVPSRKLEPEAREKWDKFANIEPESAVEKPAEEVKKVEEKPAEPKPEAPVEPEKKSRFKSLEEAEAEFEKTEGLLKKSQAAIDAANAEAEIERKKFKEASEKLSRKVDEAKPKEPEPDYEIPEAPDAPDVGDKEKYPEGAFDENYIKDNSAFTKAHSQWSKKTTETLKKLKDVAKKNRELEDRLAGVEKHKDESIARESRKVNEEIETETEKAVNQVQADLGLAMTCNWKQISSDATILRNEKATPEAKKAAQARIDLISDTDRAVYEKLAKAASLVLDSGRPRYKVGSNMYKAALMDGGFNFSEEKKPAPKVDLEKPQPDKGISGISPDKIGSDDNFSELTKEEKHQKLLDIGRKYDEEARRTGNRMEKNSFYKERITLKKELGY